MIQHYLKVAFRNLWKYKSQTLISVVGLAVGFACFALATLWIRYEMSYDGFHKNADHLYRVSVKDKYGMKPDGLTTFSDAPLAAYLTKTFPEIRNATKIVNWKQIDATIEDGVSFKFDVFWTDSSFFSIFDIKIIEGNMDFMIPENEKIAITQEKARQIFGKENPIGKAINLRGKQTVGAVIDGFPKNTNYPFDILGAYDPYYENNIFGSIVVELVPGIDVESFMKTLSEYKATAEYQYRFETGEYFNKSVEVEKIILASLTSLHYKDPYVQRDVKFQHIIIFAVAGSLLILCTLFNYITLFVCRFRMRMREFALRIVCGASNSSLYMLLSVEFLMSLLVALSLGVLLIQAIIPYFRTLSGIDIEQSFIYLESLGYISIVILVSLLTFLPVLYMFRRRSLNSSILRNNGKIFRKTSIVVQLIISICFAFCTIIIMKQMYYLHNTDLGFDMKNHGCVEPEFGTNIDMTALHNQMKQIPEITESMRGTSLVFASMFTQETFDWEGRPGNMERIKMERTNVSETFAKFYDLKLVAGEMLSDNDDDNHVMINESAAKIFGWENPTGQSFKGNSTYFVKGVLKNIYSKSPTIPIKPTIYKKRTGGSSILFKYREGTWKTCVEKIMQLIKEKHPEINENKISLFNEEEEYDKFLKSENTLLKLLTLISLVCVLVCVFGFVSMVSLTCEERRKEIAIRKINGATIKDILDIFFKEHLTLLVVGALIAFPVGYLIMKRWLESYVVQTEMNAWVYLSILLALIMAIVLCVGRRVYKTSRENPVNAIAR